MVSNPVAFFLSETQCIRSESDHEWDSEANGRLEANIQRAQRRHSDTYKSC
jgi:hypothetical protein